MALWGASVACVLHSDRWDVNMLGAFLMAVFWQQCGWLAHDFLHHQVCFHEKSVPTAVSSKNGLGVGLFVHGSPAIEKQKHHHHWYRKQLSGIQ